MNYPLPLGPTFILFTSKVLENCKYFVRPDRWVMILWCVFLIAWLLFVSWMLSTLWFYAPRSLSWDEETPSLTHSYALGVVCSWWQFLLSCWFGSIVTHPLLLSSKNLQAHAVSFTKNNIADNELPPDTGGLSLSFTYKVLENREYHCSQIFVLHTSWVLDAFF